MTRAACHVSVQSEMALADYAVPRRVVAGFSQNHSSNIPRFCVDTYYQKRQSASKSPRSVSKWHSQRVRHGSQGTLRSGSSSFCREKVHLYFSSFSFRLLLLPSLSSSFLFLFLCLHLIILQCRGVASVFTHVVFSGINKLIIYLLPHHHNLHLHLQQQQLTLPGFLLLCNLFPLLSVVT